MILEKKPGSLQNITTNGTINKAMMDLFGLYGERLKDCALHVSIDGINCHDKQRGESLNTILMHIKQIRESFPWMKIRLKFTITRLNYADIIPTYGFKIKLAEDAVNYTNRLFGSKMSRFTAAEEKSIVKDLFRIYKDFKEANNKDAAFINKTIAFIAEKGGKGFCKTPFNRIFVMPDGEVYSCIHYQRIGNINDNSLEEIWLSAAADSIRQEVERNGCGKCVAYHGYSLY